MPGTALRRDATKRMGLTRYLGNQARMALYELPCPDSLLKAILIVADFTVCWLCYFASPG
jgi:hypothetical protein